jgi:hypothetical protein
MDRDQADAAEQAAPPKRPAKFGDIACGIFYVDLAENPPPPPDMPAKTGRLARVRLRVIGGREPL